MLLASEVKSAAPARIEAFSAASAVASTMCTPSPASRMSDIPSRPKSATLRASPAASTPQLTVNSCPFSQSCQVSTPLVARESVPIPSAATSQMVQAIAPGHTD
jgi:hypothetical protein